LRSFAVPVPLSKLAFHVIHAGLLFFAHACHGNWFASHLKSPDAHCHGIYGVIVPFVASTNPYLSLPSAFFQITFHSAVVVGFVAVSALYSGFA